MKKITVPVAGLVAAAGLAAMSMFLLVAAVGAVTGAGAGAAAAEHEACVDATADEATILATIRRLESGGDYQARVALATASGAYQMIDATWRYYAAGADVDLATYPTAADAPALAQDRAALALLRDISARYGGQLGAVPVAWYIGTVPEPGDDAWDTVPYPDAGNILTPREYQHRWLDTYNEILDDPDAIVLGCATITPSLGAGDWALPAPAELVTLRVAAAPHHTYPAWDLLIPTGTPIYAATSGTVDRITNWPHNWWRYGCGPNGTQSECRSCGVGVTIQRHDGLRHTYCHLDQHLVTAGQTINPGDLLGYSGDTGRSGAPHLHLQLSVNGIKYCPQPILVALINNEPSPPLNQTTGCFF